MCRSVDFVLLFCLARRSRFVLLRRQGGGHVCKGYPLGLGLLFDLNPGNLASGRLARMGFHLQAGALAIVRASGLVSVLIRLVCSCLAASGSSSRLFRVTLAESVALGNNIELFPFILARLSVVLYLMCSCIVAFSTFVVLPGSHGRNPVQKGPLSSDDPDDHRYYVNWNHGTLECPGGCHCALCVNNFTLSNWDSQYASLKAVCAEMKALLRFVFAGGCLF